MAQSPLYPNAARLVEQAAEARRAIKTAAKSDVDRLTEIADLPAVLLHQELKRRIDEARASRRLRLAADIESLRNIAPRVGDDCPCYDPFMQHIEAAFLRRSQK